MIIKLDIKILIKLGLFVAEQNGVKIEKKYHPSCIAKEIIHKNGDRKKELGLHGAVGLQGYLLNYIQNKGKIVFPIKDVRIGNRDNHPWVEIPDDIVLAAGVATGEKVHKKHAGERIKNYIQKREDFYKSFEWKRLRYKVLEKNGARCMCCGRTAKDGVKICVDHIKPLCSHWHLRLDENNLQVLCDECNLGKYGDGHTDWR